MSHTPQLKTQTDPFSETLCSFVYFRTQGDGRRPKTQELRVLYTIVRILNISYASITAILGWCTGLLVADVSSRLKSTQPHELKKLTVKVDHFYLSHASPSPRRSRVTAVPLYFIGCMKFPCSLLSMGDMLICCKFSTPDGCRTQLWANRPMRFRESGFEGASTAG
jgi:hypothetical protein